MKKILINLFALFFCVSIQAQTSASQEAESRCVSIEKEKFAAIGARDFVAFRDLMKWALKNCKNHRTRDAYFGMFGDLALAERQLGNLSSAMNAVDQCIKNRYGLPQCHVEKFAIFNDMGKIKEAIGAAKTAKYILQQAIEENKKSLLDAKLLSYEKNMHESELGANEGMLWYVNNFLHSNNVSD